MKNRIHIMAAILLLCGLAMGCGQKNHSDRSDIQFKKRIESGSKAKFEFTKELHKFGKISEGEIVVCNFYFKNIGEQDLIISNIESSCGCTVAKWDKKPIASGKESKITVEFDSHGRYGSQYKEITVYSNAVKKKKILKITAMVN